MMHYPPRADIRVSTVQEALKFHESPKDYVGKKVVVSGAIAMIIGDDFRRNSETDGYLFSWKCGATASGAENFGNNFGLLNDKMNYWCNTDSGILVKEKLKAEQIGDKIYYHRMNLTFDIKTKKVEKFGREQEYYVAELIWIQPK
ncbi:hypothetical protein [Tautonia plasticadhaerens]|uniref:Uncharacterized protein n=1 Tax=Tautonia plasticadhaerens TaxID=2527974 RepID=A0A518HDC9_9BACT|nr:hypothetical protein [Tautonia plasticadhaerens]QDV38867.1 hypothetical protein ElP_68260 [Tautonia plasticadhaerens]